MKELTIEEKAQRYDEALKVIKDNLDTLNEVTKTGAEGVDIQAIKNCFYRAFPELKESEGEQIRKALLRFHKSTIDIDGIKGEDILTWLEKQCEQKLTVPKWRYKNDNTPLLRDSLILNKYGCVCKSPSGALVNDVWVMDYGELAKLPKEEIEKQDEQKPADKIEQETAWSENDEYVIERLFCLLNNEQENCPQLSCDFQEIQEFKDWLKSLKDRVQPKQEWSEEDERERKHCVDFLNHPDMIEAAPNIANGCKDWLKSLRPQNRWKPSDEQMNAFDAVLVYNPPCSDKCRSNLITLYNELKKLREE